MGIVMEPGDVAVESTIVSNSSDELKDTFMDIVVHDLLNPLAVVLGLLEILETESNIQSRNELTVMAKQEIKRTETMMRKVSKLAKVEMIGEIPLVKDDLGDILRRSTCEHRHAAEERIINIEYSNNNIYPALLNVFANDIFDNLISNAIKYSPEGGRIVIAIEDADKFWKVSIKDWGEGVPDKYKEAIFERFKRRNKGGVKGTGLGLAIVKKVVELHKGKVWVEDNPEGGSVFYVTLPKAD